jgi:ribosomal 30S subunit maturation factor RimM
MSANKNLWLATASALVLFASAPAFAQNQQPNVTVVQPDGPAEQAGQAIDNAANNAANAAGNAADSAANAANRAGQAAENAANQAQETAENAAEQAEEAGENAQNAAAEAKDAVDDTAQAETPVQGQIFEQSPDQYLASTLLDAVVMNSADEEIGDVNDMILTKDGKVQGVVIGVGGFLGVGEKDVAIELTRLEITQDEDGDLNFMLDATADELANAPEFTTQEDAQAEAEANSATTPGASPMTPAAPAAPAAQ